MNVVVVSVYEETDNGLKLVTDWEFNLHTLTTPTAIKIRPEIDRTIRMLRMAGDFCDSLIDLGRNERARAHKQKEDVKE